MDQIFSLKHLGERAGEKKQMMYGGFMDLEKVYIVVN